MAIHNCPRCRMPMSEERRKVLPAVCDHCGYVISAVQTHADDRTGSANVKIILGVSAALLVAFSQLSTWGSYSLEIRWLQVPDLVGFSTVKSLDRMVAICTELKKSKCVEYAYTRQAQLDRKMTVKLAEFHMNRQRYKEAAAALKPYVTKTKTDAVANLQYAQALGELGQIDESIQYYEYVLNSKRQLQPQVISSYVKHLSRNKRFHQAQGVIIRMRRTFRTRPGFMDSELKVLAEFQRAETDRNPIARK